MNTKQRSVVAIIVVLGLSIISRGVLLLAQPAVPPVTDIGRDPTVDSLRATVEAQQLQIDRLIQEQELSRRELQLARAEVSHDLESGLWPMRFVGIAAALLGVGTLAALAAVLWNAIQRASTTVETRVTKQLNERFDRVDPTMVRIHVKAEHAYIEEILERSRFSRIVRHTRLNEECLSGVIVVEFSDNPTAESTDTMELLAFIDEFRPDPARIGILIVTHGRVPEVVLKKYPTLTFANSHVTISSNTFNLARLIAARSDP